jgi:multidrug transporter EmrE-like cation transporter
MLTGILLIIVAGILWGGVGVLFSRVIRAGVPAPAYYASAALFVLPLAAAFHVRWSVLLHEPVPLAGRLAVVMGLGGMANLTGMLLMMAAMRRGHQGASWAIGQTAMVIPFLASVLVWGDQVSAVKFGGVASVAGAIVLLGLSRDRGRPGPLDVRWLATALLCLAVLGAAQTLFTVPSRWPGWTDAANLRIPLGALGGLVVGGIVCVARGIRPNRLALTYAACGALLTVISQNLFFDALDRLAASGLLFAAYPLAVGVCIVAFALYSRLALREHFGWGKAGGVALGLLGITLISVN